MFVAGLLASAGEITTADVKDLAAEHMAAINQELEEKYGRSFTFGNVRLMPMPRHVVELSWRCVGLDSPQMSTLNQTFSTIENKDIGLYLNIYNFFGFLWTAQVAHPAPCIFCHECRFMPATATATAALLPLFFLLSPRCPFFSSFKAWASLSLPASLLSGTTLVAPRMHSWRKAKSGYVNTATLPPRSR